MSFIAAAVIGAAGAGYAANRASSAAKKAARSQERAAQGLADSADYAADMSYKLGKEQLDFARQQYDEAAPIRDQVVGIQLRAQEQQMEQAGDYYDYMSSTFRPGERKMAADARAYDTDAMRERLASEASQRAALAFQGGQQTAARELSRRGLNINSGAYAGMTNANAVNQAAMQATGANNARITAEQLAWARNLDVAGLGRNLPGASSAAYAGANNSGNSAVGNQMAPGATVSGMIDSGTGTIMNGINTRTNAYGNILSSANSMVNNANDNFYGILGTGIGAAGTMYASYYGSKN